MKKLFAIILSLGLIIAPMPAAHAANGGGYAKQILGLANGIIGGAILTKCKMGSMQASLTIYMAGSLVFIAAEILGGKKKQKSIDGQAESLDAMKAGMAEGGDYQMAAIDAQLADEKSTLEFIQKRRKWMMATKLIYTAAMIMAILEQFMAIPPPVGLGKTDQAACSGPSPTHNFLTKAVIMAYGALQSSGGSFSVTGMGVGMAAQVAMKKFGPKVTLAATTADTVSVPLLNSSISRSLFFGAAAGLVFIIDGGLKKEEEASKKKIADLEKVREEFRKNSTNDNALAEGSDGDDGAEGGAGAVKDSSKKPYALRALPRGVELAKHCYSSGSGGVDFSEAGCKNPIKLTSPTFDAKFNIPSLTAVGNMATDMANAVSSGDLSRADIEAGNLVSQAGRLDAIKNDLVKKLNDQLKKEGKKPLDINEELNRQITELNKALNKNEAGSGNFSLADVTGDEASGSDASGDVAEANEISTAGTTATVALPAADAQIDLSNIGEGGIAEESTIDPNANVTTLGDRLNDFESPESDISKDPDVSIFKQVSNRYFLNYTKIFQRKEISPPLTEPDPTP